MSDHTQGDVRLPVSEGQLIAPDDWTQIQQNIDNATGLLLDAIGGPNFLPIESAYSTPLAVTADGSDLNVVIGGTGQRAIIQGLHADNCPAQTLAVTAAGSSNRLDLIAVACNRTASNQILTRNIRADSDPTGLPFATTAQLAAGTATIALPPNFTTAPAVMVTPSSLGSTGQLSWTVTSTEIVISSTDPADARTVTVIAIGNEPAAAGTPTQVSLLKATATYVYVEGNSATVTPDAPAGYEPFATILVPAGATAISQTDIAYLFPQLIAPIANLVCTTLSVAQTLTALGNAVIDGTLTVTGESVLGALQASSLAVSSSSALAALTAAATVLASLEVSGNALIDGNATVSGTANLVDLVATIAQLASLVVSGNTTLDGTLTVEGSTTLAALSATETTLQTLNVTGSTQLGLLIAAASTLASLTVDSATQLDGTLNVSGATVLAALQAAATQLASLAVSGNTTLNTLAVSGSATFAALAAASIVVSGALQAATLDITGGGAIAGGLAVTGGGTFDTAQITGPLEAQGLCFMRWVRVQSTSTVLTVTLPTLPAIPGVTWQLLAEITIDLGSGHSVNLTGSGANSTWEGGSMVSDQPGIESAQLGGTSTGGGAPSVTATFSAAPSGVYFGILRIFATSG
jgi:hypothetical protein